MKTTMPIAASCIPRAFLALATLLSAGWTQAQEFETPTSFRATDYASAAMLEGPLHRVDAQVVIEGGMPRFTIRSQYGTWQAYGRELLAIRVAELSAFRQMEGISKTDEFGKAAKAAAAAPVQMVGGLIEKPGETVSSIGSGIGLIASRVGHVASAAALRVGDKVSGNAGEQKPILKPVDAAAGTAQPRTITGDPLGFNLKRREWAQQLKVDPYTNNAALAEQLDSFAAASFAGYFPVKLTLGMVAAPLSYTDAFNEAGQLEAYQFPGVDIEMRNTGRLKNLGVVDLPVRKLSRNRYFTPTLQTALVLALESFGTIPGQAEIVEFAARAAADNEARYVVGSLALLAAHGKAMAPIARLHAADNVIAATTADGKLLVPVALDYIPWVRAVDDFARRADLKGKERWVLASGKVTPMAKDGLGKSGWKVMDNLTASR